MRFYTNERHGFSINHGGIGDGQFAGGIELPTPPPPNDRQEATTSTSNGDDSPPPPLLDGGNFGGLLIPTLQGEGSASHELFTLFTVFGNNHQCVQFSLNRRSFFSKP